MRPCAASTSRMRQRLPLRTWSIRSARRWCVPGWTVRVASLWRLRMRFFTEWFAAIEPSINATTWQNWKDYAAAYVIPRIGGQLLQSLDEPQLLKLYGRLLAEGRIKPDR